MLLLARSQPIYLVENDMWWSMVEINTLCSLESFRRFAVISACRSFMPKGYLKDPTVFPERDSSLGAIYVEAASKVDLRRIQDINFVKVHDVLGVIYMSKSGNTDLKWRQIRGKNGRLKGEASINSLANLLRAKILKPEDLKDLQRETGDSSRPEGDD